MKLWKFLVLYWGGGYGAAFIVLAVTHSAEAMLVAGLAFFLGVALGAFGIR